MDRSHRRRAHGEAEALHSEQATHSNPLFVFAWLVVKIFELGLEAMGAPISCSGGL